MFFLDFWKINPNISKIFPLLKIFGNKNGIFRGTPGNLAKRWVFFLSFSNLSKVAPRGWVFSLSFLLEFCPWVLVFSAVDVKKKAWHKHLMRAYIKYGTKCSVLYWLLTTIESLLESSCVENISNKDGDGSKCCLAPMVPSWNENQEKHYDD